MKKTAVLFNPSSGRGRALRRRRRIVRFLQRNGIAFEWMSSRSESHLRELTRGAARDYPFLIAVGGDTTFQIVASEILAAGADPALGLLGAGSNNDVVRGLGDLDLEAIGAAILANRTRRMDVGRIEIPDGGPAIHFLGTLSLGLGACVNQHVAQFWKRHPLISRGGFLPQTLAGIWGIRRSFRERSVPVRLRLKIDDREEDVDFSLMVFANVPSYAGGLKLAPQVTPFSGTLDCCVVGSDSFSSTFAVGMRVLGGRHLDRPGFMFKTGKAFAVRSPVPIDLQFDGEVIRQVTNFRVSVQPQVLKVLV